MRAKNTAFYRGNTEILVDFSSEDISCDGSLVLLEKLEREHKLLHYFSTLILDKRHWNYYIRLDIKKRDEKVRLNNFER